MHSLRMCGAIPPLLQYALMAWYLPVIKQWIWIYDVILSQAQDSISRPEKRAFLSEIYRELDEKVK